MPSSLRPRRQPTASVKRCSRFQRSPSGSRTGRLAKRWHGSRTITRPSKRPHTTRPLEAPKSTAAYSVKVEHLLHARELELALEFAPPCPLAGVRSLQSPPSHAGSGVGAELDLEVE